MDWISALNRTLSYIEEHIRDEKLDVHNLARVAYTSPGYLQKGFSVLTGMSIGEYVRNRRLYLAALDINSGTKVIDAALNYGYESPDSFTKAFSKFHGCTPKEIKAEAGRIKVFLPFTLNISIDGGGNLKPEITLLPSFRLAGCSYEYDYNKAQIMIPGFWEDFYLRKKSSENLEFINCNKVGTFGICNDSDYEKGIYIIAGEYKGGTIPEGFSLIEVPQKVWAKFKCCGPIPSAIQSMNSAIYKNWLCTNGMYELDGTLDVEWYSPEGSMTDLNYESEIWLPVKRKHSSSL